MAWVHQEIKREFNATLLSIEGMSDGRTDVLVNPVPQKRLKKGDKIIFIAENFSAALGEKTIEAAD